MARRRRVLLGMGALVFGSGAMSVNAAFANDVSTGSDMRVVADEGDVDLDVEPGEIFRPGGPNSNVDPSSITSGPGAPGDVTIFDNSGSNAGIFDNYNGGGGLRNDGIVDDLPAASVDTTASSPIEDGDIRLEYAVALDESGRIGNQATGTLQVRNDTGTDYHMVTKFEDSPNSNYSYEYYGDDVGSSNDQVSKDEVCEIFTFKGEGGEEISPDISGTNPPDRLTVPSGEIKQIHLHYDTTGQVRDSIAEAAGNNNPFTSNNIKTVDLVKQVRVEAFTDPNP